VSITATLTPTKRRNLQLIQKRLKQHLQSFFEIKTPSTMGSARVNKGSHCFYRPVFVFAVKRPVNPYLQNRLVCRKK
jgi:hypothetical protein